MIPRAFPMCEAMWSAVIECRGRAERIRYRRVEYVFSAYCSRLARVG